MTDLVKMVMDKNPVEFKEAISKELMSRVGPAIAEIESQTRVEVFGEEAVANKDDMVDGESPSKGPKASDPKAKNPGAEGHEQEDEKKTGDKKVTHPMNEEEDKSEKDMDKKEDESEEDESDEKDMDKKEDESEE